MLMLSTFLAPIPAAKPICSRIMTDIPLVLVSSFKLWRLGQPLSFQLTPISTPSMPAADTDRDRPALRKKALICVVISTPKVAVAPSMACPRMEPFLSLSLR